MSHDNKFGMFIHWGIYATLGYHEQAQARLNIDREEYESLVKTFNPTEYDPEKWVLLAKEAGMKYICFTAKHHDGFCMWDTKHTDYNIMNTPYGKDVLKMLSDACKKHGMLLSVYYSNPDWHHEYGFNPTSTHQWPSRWPEKLNTEKYREYVKAQIKEIFENYGPLYTFFWDIPPRIYDPSMNEFIRSLQPDVLINDRGWDSGDFSTPEREYESTGGKWFYRMTEACNSVGVQSWGYREGENFYSMRHLISSIDRIMAMNGSYLLNVGPDAKGVVREEYASRIRKIGNWYNRMQGCLESAECDTFDYKIGHNEYIPTKKNGKTYLHFYNGLMSDSVAIENYPSMPKAVKLMNTGENLPFKVDALPEYFNFYNGRAEREFLHIVNIPVDDLAGEAIVIEIEW